LLRGLSIEDRKAVMRFMKELAEARTDDGVDDPVELVAGPTGEDAATATGGPAGFAPRPSWDLEDLQRLANGETATTARWARALDVCAESPETYFPTSEIAKRSGMRLAEWRDAPRKSRRILGGGS
jgi:hypothetical protein